MPCVVSWENEVNQWWSKKIKKINLLSVFEEVSINVTTLDLPVELEIIICFPKYSFKGIQSHLDSWQDESKMKDEDKIQWEIRQSMIVPPVAFKTDLTIYNTSHWIAHDTVLSWMNWNYFFNRLQVVVKCHSQQLYTLVTITQLMYPGADWLYV